MSINFGLLSGAVGDLFGAAGDKAEAGAYGKAASIDLQNAVIAKQSGAIQEAQLQRQVFQVQGATAAQAAGAGLSTSGSTQDIIRSSAQQSSLNRQLIEAQTQINVQSYQEQAAAMKGMQGAAKASAGGGLLGGIVSGVGAFFGL